MIRSLRSLGSAAAALLLAATFTAAPARATAPAGGTIALRQEYGRTLTELVTTLEALQIPASASADAGALRCPHCQVLHTRAAEAVWPFAWLHRETGEARHLQAARSVADWLLRQQQADGSWKETPEEWTGTTTDQLLMLVLACQSLGSALPQEERARWLGAIERAADYLARVMSPEFASINYVATTTASLAAAHQLVPKETYLLRARAMARQVIAKMDEDGFIQGEGGKCHDIKLGVDLGYSLEMSLWGLGYYARLTGDTLVDREVKRALVNHVLFLYPDGSMDGSWGIRSNKWTVYGSGTSDGCQVLFSLYGDENPIYPMAAWRNLEFLRTCIRDGLVQYGPHHGEVMPEPPCIYPTFAKAKNLALAMLLETRATRPVVALPSQQPEWQRHFKTLDVVTTRTARYMATVTAYRYRDIAKGPDSKYMFRPSGGALSYLWLDGHGMLQASSQTEYHRWEPMHFPEAAGLRPLTPRLEYQAKNGYFTNLYEFDGRLESGDSGVRPFVVTTAGELKDRTWHYGGVGYRLTHTFAADRVRKTVTLFYHGSRPEVRGIEPVIHHPGMTFTQVDPRTVLITGRTARIRFHLLEGDASLVVGREADRYWSPYPALRAYPLEWVLPPPRGEAYQQTVTCEFVLEPLAATAALR